MRSVCVKILTVSMIVLAASPAFAQQQGRRGGRGGFGGGAFMAGPSALLRMEAVQKELKITDDQKAQLAKIGDKYKEDLAQARTDRNFEKMGTLMKAQNEAVEKAIPTILKPNQVKRLKQLEVQRAPLLALSKEDVQTALKLTDAQKKSIKDSSEELTKDMQEMRQSAQGDRSKFAEMRTKMESMQKEALDKAVSSFTPEQKKEWKELNGEKFEFPAFGQGGRRGGRRPGAGAPPPSDK